MAEIDTWMPWHIAEYLADTMHLSTLEHGAYLLILGHGWRNGGTIVASDAHLAGVTKLPKDQWKAIRPTIERFFEAFEHPTLGPCWKQKRQVEEIEKAKGQKAKAAERTKNATDARQRQRDEVRDVQRNDERNVHPRVGKGKDSSDLPPEDNSALGDFRPEVRSQEAVALGAQAKLNPPQALTPKEEFWDPLCRIFALKPATVTDEQRLWQQCRDFRLKGATVPEIEARATNYRVMFPRVAFTPNAVLNNWDLLEKTPAPKADEQPVQKKSRLLA